MASGNDDFDGDGSNPFALPPDEEIFKMREDEKRRKQEVFGCHNAKLSELY